MSTVRIEGAAELDKVLRLLPEEISRKVVSSALLAGARITAAEMKARAPVGAEDHVYQHRSKGIATRFITSRKAGYGKSQIRARLAQRRELASAMDILRAETSVIALAGVSARAFYMKFVEWGWMLTTHGTKGARRQIKHIPPKPFLRPAWESTKEAALNRVGEILGKGIEVAAQKLAGSYSTSGFSKRGRTFIR